mgnify:CR=1 FL=1
MINSPPPEGEIHLWQIDRCTVQPWGGLFRNLLSPGEKDRADRYLLWEKKDCFLYGRGLLRVLLAAYTGHQPDHLFLDEGPWGKPFLPDSSLAFNLSHSCGFYIFAFARHIPLGVDLERMVAIANPEQIADNSRIPGRPRRRGTDQEAAPSSIILPANLAGEHFKSIPPRMINSCCTLERKNPASNRASSHPGSSTACSIPGRPKIDNFQVQYRCTVHGIKPPYGQSCTLYFFHGNLGCADSVGPQRAAE